MSGKINKKKIFLMGFSTPILIEVAKNLKQKGIEIVYWQGYRYYFETLIKDKGIFANTIFHRTSDAIKNIPPPEVDASKFEPVSKEIIEKLYVYGWPVLSMVNRADYSNAPFVKKRNLYYRYLKFWQGMLKKLKPDAIIFIFLPGSAVGYTLYGLAKVLKIKTIMLDKLIIDGRVLLMNDYQQGSIELVKEYQRFKDKKCQLKDLSKDLQAYYIKQTEPAANSRQVHLNTRFNKIPFRIPNFKVIIKHLYQLTFFKTAKNYLNMLFATRKTKYFDKDLTGLKLTLLHRKWSKLNKVFKQEYKQLQTAPDYKKKYIYLPLNYQPEQTTCPVGSVFDDLLLMIDIVASALPPDWVLYVKEHLPQWYPHHTASHIYRYPGYYQQIASLPRTYLVPAETSPFGLIANAQAVATVTGTAGWEALLRSKPVLLFGYVWYMHCEGTFRVTDKDSCQAVINKIKQGYKINQQQVINFLTALDKASFKAKNYKTLFFKEDKYISKEENIANIIDALSKAILND